MVFKSSIGAYEDRQSQELEVGRSGHAQGVISTWSVLREGIHLLTWHFVITQPCQRGFL